MARKKAGNGQGYSGKVGGVVYVQSNGQEIIRTVQVRGKKSWTDKQKLHRQRFKAINDYCAKYKRTIIPQIWNLAAEDGHGYNLFLKANKTAFSLNGELTETDNLHFSSGKLPFPQHIKAGRSASDPSRIEASWINDENLPLFYDHDELMMVCSYPDHFTAIIATGITRKMSQGIFDLPQEPEKVNGIWLFFRSNKKDGYSEDQYIGI